MSLVYTHIYLHILSLFSIYVPIYHEMDITCWPSSRIKNNFERVEKLIIWSSSSFKNQYIKNPYTEEV